MIRPDLGQEVEFLRSQVEALNLELVRRNQQLRDLLAIVNTVPDILFTLDHEGRLSTWNQAMEQVTGYTPEELRNKPAVEFVPSEEQDTTIKAIQRALTQGYAELDGQLLTKDGRCIPYHWTGAALKDARGNVLGVSGMGRDVTERVRAEHTLRTTQFAMDHAVDAIYWINPQAHILYTNHAASRMLGFSADEFRAMTVHDLNPDFHAAMWPQFWQETQERKTLSLETCHRAKDGRVISVEVHVNYLAYGCQAFHCVFVRDITERKRVGEALQQSEERFRAFLEHAPNLAFLKSIKGRYVYVNRQFEATFGMTREDILGKSDGDLFPPHQAEHFMTHDRQVLAQGHAQEFEEVADQREGTRINLVVKFPVRDAQGAITSIGGIVTDITERKRGEEAVRESEERFRRIFEEAPLGMCIVGRDKRLLRVNRRLCEIVGYAESELVGRTYEAYTHPDDLPKNLQLTEEFFLGERAGYELEKRYRCKGGEEKWVKVTATMVSLQGGGSSTILAMIEDITERKRADATIRDSETRLNEAQRIAHIGSWELDLRADRLTWSDEIYRIFEIDPAKFGASYDAFLTAVHPEDRAGVNHAYLTSVLQRTSYDLVHRLLMSDGRVKYVHERCETLYSPQGVPIKSLGTVQDITDRKQAELAVEERERLFRTLAEVAPVGIFRTDAEGQCLYVNDRWCAITGLNSDHAAGGGWISALHPDERERIADGWRAAVQARQPFTAEYRFQRPDRIVTWVVGQAVAEYDECGVMVGYVGTVTDITERKAMEEALRDREQTLQKVLMERERLSQDLHDGVLQSLFAVGLGLESCKQLVDQNNLFLIRGNLDRATSQMNGVMAEIRNFIAGISTSLMVGETFASAVRKVVQAITDFHAMECAVNIDEATAGSLSIQQASQLLHIVQETLSNCVRHGGATQVHIQLARRTSTSRLTVSDNGRGFDPSQRHGIGHGLINITARAKLLGGRCVIRSAPGYGTRVMVYFPKE